MYALRQFFISVLGVKADEIISDEIICTEADIETTFKTNRMQDTLAAYTYMLVEQGTLTLNYNGRILTLRRGDIYIYSPGFQITIVSGSPDYHARCLMADEKMTLTTPTIRNIIRAAYLPIVEWGEPVVHLPEPGFDRLRKRMVEVVEYQKSPHRFRDEVLRTLYTLFLLDLSDVQERAVVNHRYQERTTELFVGFIRLLSIHFIDHHDVGFYASELCITPTHLSRIVRQVTGRTVVDYVNQMLLMEASWLLLTTNLPLSVIAERLHFANQSSFGKFFRRMKGVSPKAYRSQQ